MVMCSLNIAVRNSATYQFHYTLCRSPRAGNNPRCGFAVVKVIIELNLKPITFCLKPIFNRTCFVLWTSENWSERCNGYCNLLYIGVLLVNTVRYASTLCPFALGIRLYLPTLTYYVFVPCQFNIQIGYGLFNCCYYLVNSACVRNYAIYLVTFFFFLDVGFEYILPKR